MAKYRDTKAALIANGIFNGVLLITAVVMLFLNDFVEFNFTSLLFFLASLFFLSFIKTRSLMKEDLVGNSFVWLLLLIVGIIGAVATVVFAAFCFFEGGFSGDVVWAFLFAVGFEQLFKYMDEFVPSDYDFPTEFFNDFGFMIFFPACILIMGIIGIFINVAILVLLIINLLLASAFAVMRNGGINLASFITTLVTVGVNAFILFVCLGFDVDRLYADGVYMFYVAVMMFVALAIIICAAFHLLEMALGDVNETYSMIMYLVLPVVSFGLQFLMFYHWKAALITLGAVIGIVILMTLLYKVTCTVFFTIFYGIKYIFTGEFIRDMFKSKPKSSAPRKTGSKTPHVHDVQNAAIGAAQACYVEVVRVSGSAGNITVTLKNARDRHGNNHSAGRFMDELAKSLPGYDLSGVKVLF